MNVNVNSTGTGRLLASRLTGRHHTVTRAAMSFWEYLLNGLLCACSIVVFCYLIKQCVEASGKAHYRARWSNLKKAQLFAGPTFRNCWSFGHHSSPLNPRALPLGRLTKRTRTHTPVPPNPAVEPLGGIVSLNSFCLL